jgi:diguanylate cyclase (GGDEF)-like protein
MVRVGLLSAQRTHAEQALIHQAAHDPLTQLLNRRAFVTRLGDMLAHGRRCVLLYCDLDDFKEINDRYGHAAGDELLVEVAHRIRSCTPQPQVISRFGGDEFVVLLCDATYADGEAVADCIATALARPFDRPGRATIGVSVGIAATTGMRDPEQAIRAADRSMYRAKAERRPSPRWSSTQGAG